MRIQLKPLGNNKKKDNEELDKQEEEEEEEDEDDDEDDDDDDEEEEEEDDDDGEEEEEEDEVSPVNKIDSLKQQYEREEMCQICFDKENVVQLQPCLHRSLCESCYDTQVLEDPRENVLCPVCIHPIKDIKTKELLLVEQVEEIEKGPMDKNLAIENRGRKLAGYKVDCLTNLSVLQVSERELGDAFGTCVRYYFSQTRVLFMLFLIWLCFVGPLVLVYISAVKLTSTESILVRTTLTTCFRNKCNNEYAKWFFPIDFIGTTLVGLLFVYKFRSKTKNKKIQKTLCLIQAPHLVDKVKKNEIKNLLLQLQLDRIQRKKAFDKKLEKKGRLYVREKTPPLIPFEIVHLVNGSQQFNKFAKLAEKRLDLGFTKSGIEKHLSNTLSKTKEYHHTLSKLEKCNTKIKNTDIEIQNIFLKEMIGRLKRNTFQTDYCFVTFATEDQAQFAKELLDEEGGKYHPILLGFGAPFTRFQSIGTEEQVYAENIDWSSFENPHAYAQSPKPFYFHTSFLLSTLLLNLFGFSLWNTKSYGDHYSYIRSILLFLWQIGTTKWIHHYISTYKYPFVTERTYLKLVTTFVLVDFSSTFLWPFIWWIFIQPINQPPCGDRFWKDRMLDNIIHLQCLYLVQHVLWWIGFDSLYVYAKRAISPVAYNQYQLNMQYQPEKWNFPTAYTNTFRVMFLTVVFSGVIPGLVPIAVVSCMAMYSGEKKTLLRQRSMEFVLNDSRICRMGSLIFHFALAFRQFILYGTSKQTTLAENFFSFPNDIVHIYLGIQTFDLCLLFISSCLLLHALHRFKLVREFSYALLTCGYVLQCWCCCKPTTFKKIKNKGKNNKVEVVENDFNNFDFRENPRYKDLFSSVYTLQDLYQWFLHIDNVIKT